MLGAALPEQPRTGSCGFPCASSEGFSGLLAFGKSFQLRNLGVCLWAYPCGSPHVIAWGEPPLQLGMVSWWGVITPAMLTETTLEELKGGFMDVGGSAGGSNPQSTAAYRCLEQSKATPPILSPRTRQPPAGAPRQDDSYLVDPASSHMLVSKIKPCMSKYKQFIQ